MKMKTLKKRKWKINLKRNNNNGNCIKSLKINKYKHYLITFNIS